MTRRSLQLAVLFLVALASMGADAGLEKKFQSMGHQMVCSCSCSQILLECNHVGCPDSPRMIAELRDQIAAGGTETSIFNWFSAKYGPTVLAAPIRGGFDSVAWITPVSVFALALAVTIFLVMSWKRRATPASARIPRSAQADRMRERIRRETEY